MMWSDKYIGIPYRENGRDHSGVDCWGLVRLVYKEQYNIALPSFSTDYIVSDQVRTEELFNQYKEGWTALDVPEAGCAVLFNVMGHVSHIGVAVSATHFIHSRENRDVAIDSFDNHRWNKRTVGYYRYTENSVVVLNAAPHPLKTEKITLPVPVGTSLTQVHNWVIKEYNVEGSLGKDVHILLNGRLIDPQVYSTTFVCEGDTLEYRGILRGKDPIRTLLTIALVVIAYQIVGPYAAKLAGWAGGTAAMTTTQAVIATAAATATVYAGSYLINAIAPIRPPQEPETPGATRNQLMITGAYNQAYRYGNLPVVLGKVRMTPPLGANTFAEFIGDTDNYLKMLLVWGYGPLYIDQNSLKIGKEAISNYSDVEQITLDRIAEPTNTQKTEFNAIYGSDVEQDYVGQELKYPGHSAAWVGLNDIGNARVFVKNTAGVVSPSSIGLSIATINVTGPSYQWYRGGVAISGATNANYTVSSSDFGGTTITNTYRCVVSGTMDGVVKTLYDEVDIPRLDQGGTAVTVVLSRKRIILQGPLSGYSQIELNRSELTSTVRVYKGSSLLAPNGSVNNYSIYSVSPSGLTLTNKIVNNNTTVIPRPSTITQESPTLTLNIATYKEESFINPDVGSSTNSGIETDVQTSVTINYIVNRTNLSTPIQPEGEEAGWKTSTFNAGQQDTEGNYVSRRVTFSLHYPEGIRLITTKGDDAGKSLPLASPLGFEWQIKYGTGLWNTIEAFTRTGPVKDAYTETFTHELTDNQSSFQIRARRTTTDITEIVEGDKEVRFYYKTILQTITVYSNLTPATDPLNVKVAKTAFSIRATNQISGQIEGISALVQTYCPVWTGTNTTVIDPNTWSPAATSNPAALFKYVLTHPGNAQSVTDSELDLKQIQYWYKYCNDPVGTRGVVLTGTETANDYKFTYNSVIANSGRSILETLRDICAAGRASPALIDGKWTVIIDEEKPIVQHFTPHNSWGFESTKALPKKLDGLKIRFNDEDDDYQEKENILYDVGKNATNSQFFETIDLPGITSAKLVEDHAKWHLAQIKARPEVYTLNTDIEYLVCNRGDRVKVAHDVPQWGSGTGRIKNKISTTKFDLDEQVYIDNTKSNTVRIRSETGTSSNTGIKLTFSTSTYTPTSDIITLNLEDHPFLIGDIVTVSTNIANINSTNAEITAITSTSITYQKSGNPTAVLQSVTGTVKPVSGYYSRIKTTSELLDTQAKALDLFLFGVLNKESQDLTVLTIEPTGGAKAARLTLVDYGVTETYNIFTGYKTFSGDMYTPNMTIVPERYVDSLTDIYPTVVSANIASDESVLEYAGSGYITRIAIPYTNDNTDLPASATHVEAQIDLVSNTDGVGIRSQTVPLSKGSVYFSDVEEGKVYKIRLRYITNTGRTGPWSPTWTGAGMVTHTIVGKSSPPGNVNNFVNYVKDTGVTLQWDECTDKDYAQTEIRLGESWAAGVTSFKGRTNSWNWMRPSTGTYKFYAKHIDTSGNYSLLETETIVDYTNIAIAGITVELTNDNHQIPTDSAGNNANLLFSGTDIYVYHGGSPLTYDTVGTTNGSWKIDSVIGTGAEPGIVEPLVNVTGDSYAILPDLQSIEVLPDMASIAITISGTDLSGNTFTLIKQQKFVKQKNGENLVLYRINSSTPVVYKDTPDNTTPGNFSRIRVEGRKYEGQGASELFGWLGVRPYIGNTPDLIESYYTQVIDVIPNTNDQSTKWIINLYGIDPATTPPGTDNPVLDTEEISVVFEGEVYTVEVESSNGNMFRPGQASSTILKARVFKNGNEVTDILPHSVFRWRRVSAIPQLPPADDATWNTAYQSGYKQITINVDDVYARATFFCEIII